MSAPSALPEAASLAAGIDDDLRELCEDAVDPLEIAAGLEFGGLNDEGAARYGYPDVFAYAEELYRWVPRRPAEPAETLPNPWQGSPWRHVVRGVLFGLPGLCYVTAAQAVGGSTLVLVVSLLLAWAYGQGAAYLAYVAIGQEGREAGLAVARRGLRIGLAAVLPAVVLVGLVTPAEPAGIALAAGQAAYLLAAGVILVAGGELVLLAALLPGCSFSAIHLISGWPQPWAVWAAGALSVVEAVALAEIVSRTRRKPPRGPLLRSAAPAAFGALCGGLLVAGTSAGIFAMTPLSLSMGAAEWAVFRFRSRAHLLLGRVTTVRRFARAVRAELLVALGLYLAVLLGLTLLSGHRAPLVTLAFGGAVLIALILQSFEINGPVLALFGAALAAALLVPRDWLPAQLALFTAMTVLAWTVIGRTALHR